jgi:hypothetical protein
VSEKNELTLSSSEEEFIEAVDACRIARETKSHIGQALLLAKGIKQVKAIMAKPEVYEVIEDLMNTPAGFKTDKDPNKPVYNKEKKEWVKAKPYEKVQVINCVADALSHGLYLHNNEFNIIAGQCYPAQAGFKRKLSEHKKKNGIKTKIVPGIPQGVKQGNQLFFKCSCYVEWTMPDQEPENETLNFEIVAFSADAAIGKIKKRANEWLFNELTENYWNSSEDYWDLNDAQKIKPKSDDIVIPPTKKKDIKLTAEQTEKIIKGLDLIDCSEQEFLSMSKHNLKSVKDLSQSKFVATMGWIDKKLLEQEKGNV